MFKNIENFEYRQSLHIISFFSMTGKIRNGMQF